MAKASNDDSFVDLAFPVSGIDLTTEFEEQRQGTTQEGVNVRAYEAILNRQRGGQRAGLGKYVPHRVGVLQSDGDDAPPNFIQHLAIIVDPTVEGLLSDADDSGQTVDDPSTSNKRRRIPAGRTRTVRKGGSGKQTNHRQPRLTLTVTANDQEKDSGVDFGDFAGNEYTVSGGDALGDTLENAQLWSAGVPASAPVGNYAINISSLQGTGQVPVSKGVGFITVPIKTKYKIKYVPGTLTVQDVAPVVHYLITLEGECNLAAGGTFTLEVFLDGVSLGTLTPISGSSGFPGGPGRIYKTWLDGGSFPTSFGDPAPTTTDVGDSMITQIAAGSHTVTMNYTWTTNGAISFRVAVFGVPADTLAAGLLPTAERHLSPITFPADSGSIFPISFLV